MKLRLKPKRLKILTKNFHIENLFKKDVMYEYNFIKLLNCLVGKIDNIYKILKLKFVLDSI